jgi:hypothetical protein
LYGEYIGHDNNRDGYMLSQSESQLWAKVVYTMVSRRSTRHAPAGQLRRAHHDSAQVRSHQPARRSADVAFVASCLAARWAPSSKRKA